jgi:hypothetical protein
MVFPSIPLDKPDSTDYEKAVWLIARSPSWRAKGLKQALGRLTKDEQRQAWRDGKARRYQARVHGRRSL